MKRVNLRLLIILVLLVVVGGGAAFGIWRVQRWRNAGSLVALAKQATEAKRPLEAIAILQRYLAIRPEDDSAVAELADLTLKQARSGGLSRQDVVQAFGLAENAVRRNPDNDSLRGRLAQFQMMIGQQRDALEHLAILAAKHPVQPDGADEPAALAEWDPEDPTHPLSIQLMLAAALMASGDFDKAAEAAAGLTGYDREARTFDDARSKTAPIQAFVLLAQVLFDKLDDKEAARAVIDHMTKVHGDKPDAWLTLSGWHREHNDVPAAGAAIDRALELDPENRAALFALVDLLLTQRDFAKATDAARRCIELFPDDERGYGQMANIHFNQRRPAEAEKVLREGLTTLPNRPNLLFPLAEACLQQQDVAGSSAAIASLRGILDPNNPQLMYLDGHRLLVERQYQAARKTLEQARTVLGNRPDILQKIDFLLAACYEQLGEHDAQLAAHQRVLTQVPLAIEPRIGAATAMASAGRSAEALAEFEAITALVKPEQLASFPPLWHPLLQLRINAQRQLPPAKRNWSRVDGLIDTLKSSSAITPTQIAMLRSDVLLSKGEPTLALEALERGVENDPKTPQLWGQLASLTLRQQGAAAAREVLGRVPKEFTGTVAFLLLEASVALAEGPASSDASFPRIEEQAAMLSDEEAARVLATLASLRRSSGSLDEAERLWKLAAEKTPNDLRLHTSRFETALETADLPRAEESLVQIERIGGENKAPALFGRAAVKVMRVRESLDKRQRDTERASALTAEENAALAEAQALLIEAENQRPGWNKVQVLFAEIAGLKNDLQAAIERMQRAMQLGSVSPRVVRHLVSLLYGLNRIEEAQQVLASLGAEETTGFDRLSAEMELRSGRLDEAVAVAERSINADSRNPLEHIWLGQLLERAGRREQAGKAYEKAVEIGPERVESWLSLIGYQIAAGASKAAAATLDRAAAALPEPQRTICQAQACEMLGRHDEAERHYRETVKADPDNIEVHRNLAAFLLRRGKLAEAREPLEQILATAADGQPTKVWARRTLGELLAENANFRTAQRAVAMVGENLDVSGRLPAEDMAVQVKLLSRRGEPTCWRQAIELLEKIAAQRPLTIVEQIQLTDLQEKTGRWEDCRSGLITICSLPNAPPAFVALLVEKLIAHDEIAAARTWMRLLKKQIPDSPATLKLEAGLALAQNDREAAVAAGRRLLTSAEAEGLPRDQIIGAAKLLEDLGFAKAADRLVSRLPTDSPDAVLVKVGFLGRQKRADDAFQLLEKHWDSLPLERVIQAAFEVVRNQEEPGAHAARLAAWLTKARREDPGSVMLAVMLAELRDIEGRPEEMEAIYREVLARKDVPPRLVAVVANNLAFHLAVPATAAEARRLIDSAIEELGPQPDLLDTRGMVRLAAGDASRAVEDLREAVLDPTPLKFMHLACAEHAAGNTDAARQALEKARKAKLSVAKLSLADRQRLQQLEAALQPPAAA